MKDNFDRSMWVSYFTEFTKRNQARPTVLEVFGENGAQTEERGLPFVGISLDQENGSPSIEIMLGSQDSIEPRHLTRVIKNVRDLTPKRGPDGRDEALAVIDESGEVTLLRFEPKLKATEPGFRQPSCCQSPLNVLSSITLPPPPVVKRDKLPA